MITIQVLGLDEFVVGRYSRESTEALAQAFECNPDEISFFAPNSMVFHRGVEQTSWNTLVIVLAPNKYKAVEKVVADTIGQTLNLYSIHLQVVFRYFDENARYEYINKEYPRFLTENEIRDDNASLQFGDVPEYMEGDEDLAEEHECDCDHGCEHEGECDDEHCTCGHHHHHEEEAHDEDVYLGNAFEGFEERYEEEMKKKN